MVSMLRHLGIKSHIAILLTRLNGTVSFLPGARFDHAIVCAVLENGDRLWLDPAGGPVTFKDLPSNDQGTQALLCLALVDFLRGLGSPVQAVRAGLTGDDVEEYREL